LLQRAKEIVLFNGIIEREKIAVKAENNILCIHLDTSKV
jgi:hypothetical protein